MSDAAGYVIPSAMRTRDSAAYTAAGSSLKSLMEARQREKSVDRFNVERCTAVFRGDPEYDTLQLSVHRPTTGPGVTNGPRTAEDVAVQHAGCV